MIRIDRIKSILYDAFRHILTAICSSDDRTGGRYDGKLGTTQNPVVILLRTASDNTLLEVKHVQVTFAFTAS